MPHLRSESALQRRAAKKFIAEHAFNDSLKAESVCRTSREKILDFLSPLFPNGVHMNAIPQVERGLVLSDSRGGGYFQQK